MKMLAVVFMLLNSNLFCQESKQELHSIVFANYKSFIGKTMEQVETYWSEKVSDSYYYYDTTSQEHTFSIFLSNPGEFHSTYKNNKCIEQTILLHYNNISVFQARIVKQGFIYDRKKDVWINSALKLKYKIEHLGAVSADINVATLSKL
jgi:hypothetical protein